MLKKIILQLVLFLAPKWVTLPGLHCKAAAKVGQKRTTRNKNFKSKQGFFTYNSNKQELCGKPAWLWIWHEHWQTKNSGNKDTDQTVTKGAWTTKGQQKQTQEVNKDTHGQLRKQTQGTETQDRAKQREHINQEQGILDRIKTAMSRRYCPPQVKLYPTDSYKLQT